MSNKILCIYNFPLISRMRRDEGFLRTVYMDSVGEYGGFTHYFDTVEEADKFMECFADTIEAGVPIAYKIRKEIKDETN